MLDGGERSSLHYSVFTITYTDSREIVVLYSCTLLINDAHTVETVNTYYVHHIKQLLKSWSTSSGSAEISNVPNCCLSPNVTVPIPGAMSAPLPGEVTIQVTEMLVKVPASR